MPGRGMAMEAAAACACVVRWHRAERTGRPHRVCVGTIHAVLQRATPRAMSQRVRAVETRTDTGFGIAGHGPVVGEVWRRALFSLLAHISLKTVACRQGRKCAGDSIRHPIAIRCSETVPLGQVGGREKPLRGQAGKQGEYLREGGGRGRCCWVG